MKPIDEIMQERREERLKRLYAFMCDPRLRALNMGLDATHNLLIGWFENSYWLAAWWCFQKAVRESWQHYRFTAEILYLKYILRLTESQIQKRVCGYDLTELDEDDEEPKL